MNRTLDEVRSLVAEALAPGRFAGAMALTQRHGVETVRWEVFQGRLVDEAHTREERTFETWDVGEGDGPAVLSAKLDVEAGRLHVVRGVECYAWEGYDSGGGVFLSRERRKWTRELIATLAVDDDELREELAAALGRAVTGTRLPLTPVETPLAAFSFGRLWYRGAKGELEFTLRSRPVEEVAAWCQERYTPAGLARELRRTFLDVSLSPYTGFVADVLRLLALLEERSFLTPDAVVDFEGWLLRLVCRHLTAYDLVTFHHRGANYPDALLLDAVLTDYLTRLDREPRLFVSDPLRRRALRQAYVVRRQYQLLPVPDLPTSPGEHALVYPDEYGRVPEEQILQPARRKRRLFEGDPLDERLTIHNQMALDLSLVDLVTAPEIEELGTGVVLDRPFGGAKSAIEPDATPLLASVGYSRSVAAARLRLLGVRGDCPTLPGVPLSAIGGPVRPGTLSLSDAARSMPDAVFRATLAGSLRALARRCPLPDGVVLVARSATGPGLIAYDASYQPVVTIEPRLEAGYTHRRGEEWPAAGVRVTPGLAAG